MDYLIVCLAAFLASGLTLFSGFGLGTLLLPVFAIFVPIQSAVALTAVVHLLNNLFKLALLGKHADRPVVVRFGLPAIAAAFAGAGALTWLSDLKPLVQYQAFGHGLEVMPVKLVVAILMVVFAVIELMPAFEPLTCERQYLPLGGIVSGFFGGLSGHQGALRSAFLIKSVPSQESFLGTGAVIACLVDLSRLSVYGSQFSWVSSQANGPLLVAATGSAFLGAVLGNRLITKVTLRAIQLLVGAMLVGVAVGLGCGLF